MEEEEKEVFGMSGEHHQSQSEEGEMENLVELTAVFVAQRYEPAVKTAR